MSFDGIEASNQEGVPARGYVFTLGDVVSRYVSSEYDLGAAMAAWETIAISDDGVKLSGEASVDALTITLPATCNPATLFRGTPPSRAVQVTIFNFHRNTGLMQADYVGEVTQCNWPRPGIASLTCESMFSTMARDGLRFGWQRACPYALYDERTCGVKKTDHAKAAVIESAVDDELVSAGFAAHGEGYFAGGFIEWLDPVRGLERRGIEHHEGTVLRLLGFTDGLYKGQRITAYPGCNRSVKDCTERYNNLLYFGGCPDLDGTNPFDGSPVF